jgi:hypothetical protein
MTSTIVDLAIPEIEQPALAALTPGAQTAAEAKPAPVRVPKASAEKGGSKPAPDTPPPAEKGKLFRWNGKAYEEIVFEENQDRRVPMIEEAFQAAIEIRKQVQARVRMRPDLSIVASALVLAAARNPDIIEEVARYGLEVYARATHTAA